MATYRGQIKVTFVHILYKIRTFHIEVMSVCDLVSGARGWERWDRVWASHKYEATTPLKKPCKYMNIHKNMIFYHLFKEIWSYVIKQWNYHALAYYNFLKLGKSTFVPPLGQRPGPNGPGIHSLLYVHLSPYEVLDTPS
jgi:hypothetical protein